MKVITMLFLSLILGKSCTSQAQKESINTVLEYTANTRGFYQKITIQNQMLSISKDRNSTGTEEQTKISDKDWQELIADYKAVNLDSLATLKSPTKKRLHDGAAIANFKISTNDTTYETSSFDHGNPQLEIKKLVDKITSFAKNE
jgi:hypothetical protein